jgi:hypothetical protein
MRGTARVSRAEWRGLAREADTRLTSTSSTYSAAIQVPFFTSYSHRWCLRQQIVTSTSRLNRPSPSLLVCPSSFSLLPVRLQVLMVPKEDVGGSEIHEMNILPAQSETNSNDSGASISIYHDPNPEILPGISQDEGATFYFSLTIVFQVK